MYSERRRALNLAMRRFESAHHSPADSDLSYVYMRAGGAYYVEVRGLWTSQWYCVQADGSSVDEVTLPVTKT
jgi:hypothetical protein